MIAEGRIYFLSDAGETSVIQIGPEFKLLARNPLNEKVQASMAVAHSRLLIRTEESIYCIAADARAVARPAGTRVSQE